MKHTAFSTTLFTYVFVHLFLFSPFFPQANGSTPDDYFQYSKNATGKGKYMILHSRGCGMFSILGDVLQLTREYDKGQHEGIEVDFLKEGLYYDKNHGENWFNYYFEPICLGNRTPDSTIQEYRGYPNMVKVTEQIMTRKEANHLIEKYMHIKEDVQNEIEEFVNDNFFGYFVICVHYRGTDKSREAPKVSYQTVREAILDVMSLHPDENIRIFIASDEDLFVKFMTDEFGDLICYNQNVMRSTDKTPIHIKRNSPYQTRKDAVIDCVLLSRGSVLIRTSSNLSLWSTFFNPDIPVIALNKRFGT